MSSSRFVPPVNRRRALSALALGVVAPGTLAACFGGSSDQTSPAAAPRAPTIAYEPANAAVNVGPTAPIGVQVQDGFIQRVTLTNPEGKRVAGAVTQDRTAFAVGEPLDYDVAYTWGGSVVGHDGKAVPLVGTFTTVAPAATVNGQFQLADGQVVGIAAPIILQFDAPISDKASVERALTVTTDPPVEGSWAWLPDEVGGSRVHWRTRDYYPAGTKVAVDARLYGVPFGVNAFGAQSLTLNFEIGRRQVVKAAASSYRIQVVTDDGVILDLPCSYGEGDLPRNVTRSGVHVVSEKNADFYMSNPAAGYFNVHERFAVRISNNGEFIHANPATLGVQGSTNVTNGCINLSLDNAEQYFNAAIYGDPVEVTGTSIELSYADGDIWDWAVDWDTWMSMSAIPPASVATPATSIPAAAPVMTPGAAVGPDIPTPSGQSGG